MTPSSQHVSSHEVRIGNLGLAGDLNVPDPIRGIVIFAHGSGSSRRSSRNRFVAESLNPSGFATLLMDLLTEDEERIDRETAHLRFDIPLLAQRLEEATDWVLNDPDLSRYPIGYFGASTGAAAALIAAQHYPNRVGAVVSRGGRPDLAQEALPHVKAPTLLIVGGSDEPVIALNRWARAQMYTETRLEIVPHATHLFEESGALEQVADLANDWFQRHLTLG